MKLGQEAAGNAAAIGLQLCAALFWSCAAKATFDVASASPSQFYSWDNTQIFQVGKHTDLD